jgi:ipoprotein LpqH
MVDGLPLTYNDSKTGPKPTVTKTGSPYKIVGTATSPGTTGTAARELFLDRAFPFFTFHGK